MTGIKGKSGRRDNASRSGGRPPLSQDEKKALYLQIRVTSEQKQKITEFAEADPEAQGDVSAYVRRRALQERRKK